MPESATSRVTPLREADQPPELPHNDECEAALLGAIFVNNVAFARVADFLRAEHFFNGVHGRIYEAIGILVGRGTVASPITLKNLFDQDAALAEIGGAQYLARLAASAVTILNAQSYGETLVELHRRRELIALGQDIISGASRHDFDDPVEAQIERVETGLHAIATEGAGGERKQSGPQPASLGAAEAMERAQGAYRSESKLSGLSTGLASLDRKIGGLQADDLILVGGRPGQGKTAFATTLLLATAWRPMPPLFFSLEMSRAKVGHRLLAGLTGISVQRQTRGELDRGDFEALALAQADIDASKLVIDDTTGLGIGMLRQRARFQQRRAGLGLVIVDYLQLVRATGERGDDMRDAVPKVSAGLRDLAKELHVPVVALSQLTRNVEGREDKRPMLSDLRYAGELEQDAAVVLMLYRHEVYLAKAEPIAGPRDDPLKVDKLHSDWSDALDACKGKAEIGIGKNRDGESGIVRVDFDGASSKFTDDSYYQGSMF